MLPSFCLSICDCDSSFRIYSFVGGSSFGCPENAGAAGTLYDVISESLTIDNHNKTTYTDTLLLEFPNHHLFTNLYIKNMAKVAVPLRWSRVQVC